MKAFSYIMLALLFIGVCMTGCSNDSDVKSLNAEALKLAMAGKVDEAMEKATAALEKAEKENGAFHLLTAMSLETLGTVYQAKGDADKAESSYLQALSIVQKTIGPDSGEAAKIMNNLAALYYSKKENDKAASFYKQTLAIVEKRFDADDPRLAVLRKNISICEGKGSGGEDAWAAQKPFSDKEDFPEGSQTLAPMFCPPGSESKDLVPQQIKDSMFSQLAQQNIFISDLDPLPQVDIDNKGIVFPYHAMKKGKDSDSAQEIVVLFASVYKPEKPDTVVFQQCRLISYTSYLASLEKRRDRAIETGDSGGL